MYHKMCGRLFRVIRTWFLLIFLDCKSHHNFFDLLIVFAIANFCFQVVSRYTYLIINITLLSFTILNKIVCLYWVKLFWRWVDHRMESTSSRGRLAWLLRQCGGAPDGLTTLNRYLYFYINFHHCTIMIYWDVGNMFLLCYGNCSAGFYLLKLLMNFSLNVHWKVL